MPDLDLDFFSQMKNYWGEHGGEEYLKLDDLDFDLDSGDDLDLDLDDANAMDSDGLELDDVIDNAEDSMENFHQHFTDGFDLDGPDSDMIEKMMSGGPDLDVEFPEVLHNFCFRLVSIHSFFYA